MKHQKWSYRRAIIGDKETKFWSYRLANIDNIEAQNQRYRSIQSGYLQVL